MTLSNYPGQGVGIHNQLAGTWVDPKKGGRRDAPSGRLEWDRHEHLGSFRPFLFLLEQKAQQAFQRRKLSNRGKVKFPTSQAQSSTKGCAPAPHTTSHSQPRAQTSRLPFAYFDSHPRLRQPKTASCPNLTIRLTLQVKQSRNPSLQ